MTTPPGAGAYTGAFRDQHASAIAADVDRAAAAAADADWKQATANATRVQAGAPHLHHSVIHDALTEGLREPCPLAAAGDRGGQRRRRDRLPAVHCCP